MPPPTRAPETRSPRRAGVGGRGAATRVPGRLGRYEQSALPLIAVAVLLAVWEAYGQAGYIEPLFFSYPSQIWTGFTELVDGQLVADLRTSGLEFATGLGLALVAVPVGLLVGSVRRLYYAFNPLIDGLYATPMLAFAPLFIIWFGIGPGSKIAVVALMCFFPLAVATIAGVQTVDEALVRAVRSFGATRWDRYRDVVLPSMVPFLVSGMRLAIGRAVAGVIIGEFIASAEGLGHRIRAAASAFQTPQYLAGIALLVLLSVVLNLGLRRLESRLGSWRKGMRRKQSVKLAST